MITVKFTLWRRRSISINKNRVSIKCSQCVYSKLVIQALDGNRSDVQLSLIKHTPSTISHWPMESPIGPVATAYIENFDGYFKQVLDLFYVVDRQIFDYFFCNGNRSLTLPISWSRNSICSEKYMTIFTSIIWRCLIYLNKH